MAPKDPRCKIQNCNGIHRVVDFEHFMDGPSKVVYVPCQEEMDRYDFQESKFNEPGRDWEDTGAELMAIMEKRSNVDCLDSDAKLPVLTDLEVAMAMERYLRY